MAQLTRNVNNNNWKQTVTQSVSSDTYTFETENTYLDRNIELEINIDPAYRGPDAQIEISAHNAILTSTDSNPSDVYVQTGNNKKYVQKIILDEGKNINFENDITDNVKISYDSTLNALVFNFS